MRLLLDTHIWIWSLLEPQRLAPGVRNILSNAANELCLSPISTWELFLLHSKGRLRLPGDIEDWVKLALVDFEELPLTHNIAAASVLLNGLHADPADRFLAATARVLDLTLVTADTRLLATPWIRTLANL